MDYRPHSTGEDLSVVGPEHDGKPARRPLRERRNGLTDLQDVALRRASPKYAVDVPGSAVEAGTIHR